MKRKSFPQRRIQEWWGRTRFRSQIIQLQYVLWERCNLPNGAWGKAQATNDFGAFKISAWHTYDLFLSKSCTWWSKYKPQHRTTMIWRGVQLNCVYIVAPNVRVEPLFDPSLRQQGVFGSAVNSPSGVWGEASDANDFSAFYNMKRKHLVLYKSSFCGQNSNKLGKTCFRKIATSTPTLPPNKLFGFAWISWVVKGGVERCMPAPPWLRQCTHYREFSPKHQLIDIIFLDGHRESFIVPPAHCPVRACKRQCARLVFQKIRRSHPSRDQVFLSF